MNFRRHGRFYVALAAALAVGAVTTGHDLPMRIVLAGDTLFLVYLVLTGLFVARADATHLRARAASADEGLPFILALTAATAGLSLAAIFLLLRQVGTGDTAAGILAVASVPLGWLTLHTLAAFHYANLFYAPRRGGGEAGGLDFPGTEDPGPWDFLYFAFVIGMTAQVSDVVVRTTAMRRTTLAHGIGSFFYNTVILALAVNAAVAYAG
jgi:uncharacterized membrane protein